MFDIESPNIININLNIHLKGFSMSALTDAMAAVVKAIKDSTAAVDPTHIANIDASIATLSAQEGADAEAIADIQAGLKVLTDGLAPAPDSAPDAPAS